MRLLTRKPGRAARTIARVDKSLTSTLIRAAYVNLGPDGPSLSVTLQGSDDNEYTVQLSYAEIDWLVDSREYYRKDHQKYQN